MFLSAHRQRPLLVSAACLLLLAACSGDAPDESPRPDTARSEPAAISAAAPVPVVATPPARVDKQPHDVFWDRLSALCGHAYGGFLTVGTEESDRYFGEAELRIHVHACDKNEIRIPFHVNDDRSRTFIVRRGPDGLTLHHRHLDETGASAAPDGYGGRTLDAGSPARQEFVVDDATISRLPETRNNVWSLEVAPGNYFAYELKRVAEGRYFRVEFSLGETIPTPPPPWGEEPG